MPTDEELRAMPPAQRAALARRLTALAAADVTAATGGTGDRQLGGREAALAHRRRERFLIATTASSVLLLPWIVILALTLPPRYTAAHWAVTWVGFDIGLMISLAVTAWFGYRRRQLVVLAAFVSATLLLCDAWFDVTTSSGGRDLVLSVASALLVEVPLALLLISTAVHLLHATLRHAQAHVGGSPDVRLRRLRLYGLPADPRDG